MIEIKQIPNLSAPKFLLGAKVVWLHSETHFTVSTVTSLFYSEKVGWKYRLNEQLLVGQDELASWDYFVSNQTKDFQHSLSYAQD